MTISYRVEIEQEDDGRFLAEVVDLPGVMAYETSPDDALAHIQALALRVLADRLEHDEGKQWDGLLLTLRIGVDAPEWSGTANHSEGEEKSIPLLTFRPLPQ